MLARFFVADVAMCTDIFCCCVVKFLEMFPKTYEWEISTLGIWAIKSVRQPRFSPAKFLVSAIFTLTINNTCADNNPTESANAPNESNFAGWKLRD